MTRNVLLYIKDILQNMQDAEEFIRNMTYEQFLGDKRTFNAVVRSLEVIGEAAKNVPDEVRAKYPMVPWKEMAGMRDKVIHFYFGVDREAVWLAVSDRIPAVKPQIEKILHDLETGKEFPHSINLPGCSVRKPPAVTGVRILITLLNEMKRRQSRYGMIALCGGGGMGVSGILERT